MNARERVLAGISFTNNPLPTTHYQQPTTSNQPPTSPVDRAMLRALLVNGLAQA